MKDTLIAIALVAAAGLVTDAEAQYGSPAETRAWNQFFEDTARIQREQRMREEMRRNEYRIQQQFEQMRDQHDEEIHFLMSTDQGW